MSAGDERINAAAKWSRDMANKKCTTPGHDDRKAEWLIPAGEARGHRWVCGECRDASS